MRHAVILAGGVGSRLWPVSRTNAPKQFQKFTSEDTLIQETFKRLQSCVDKENIWIVATENYRELIKKQLPNIKEGNIIIEPAMRNTAAAIGYATLEIMKTDPEAIVACSPSDHYVGKPSIFSQAFAKIFDFVSQNPNFIGTIGINPTEPNTGYGYIQLGDQLVKDKKMPIFQMAKFVEKPDQATAQEYFESWDYLWNGGYYLYNAQELIKIYERVALATIAGIKKYFDSRDEEDYKSIPNEPIDKAISEKIENIAVVPADVDWSDLGNWSTLHDIIKDRGEEDKNHLAVDTENSLVVSSDRLIATVGVKDLVIIDTGDAVLVCHREAAQNVKDVVDALKEKKKELL